MVYPPLPDGSPDELERALLDRWKEEDLFRRTLEANREGAPFVFYEGPPTANGRPGIHHVFARTIKDLGRLRPQAEDQGKRLPTLTLESEVRFATPADQLAFANALSAAFADLVRRYHDD